LRNRVKVLANGKKLRGIEKFFMPVEYGERKRDKVQVRGTSSEE
jgi:hypothetical protein